MLASLLLADQIEDLKNEVASVQAELLARSALGSEAAVVDGGALGEERGLAERIEAMVQRMATEAQLPRRLDPPR